MVSELSVRPRLTRPLVALLAVACGVAVANVYFPQAVTPLIGRDLGITGAAATTVATVTQLGYAAGILFLVPLGDLLSRRALASLLLAATGLALVGCAISTGVGALCLAAAGVGIATVVPQLLIPMAADLADPASTGRIVATLQSGLLAGILLARAFGGFLGAWLGWQAPYAVAAGLALLLAVLIWVVVPPFRAHVASRPSYLQLLRTAARLLRTEPDLRRSSFYQFCLFGGFTATWTCTALLLTGPKFHYGTGAVGLVALVGAGSVVLVPLAGRWTDRWGPDRITAICILVAVVAGVVLLAAGLGGVAGLVALLVGLLLIDIATQSSQVANQARIFAISAGMRSRLNSVYMTAVFLGGTAGSWMGARAYRFWGWAAVGALVIFLAVLAGARALIHPRRPRVATTGQ
jgi:predicted MFS family arabinose efflux permease